MKISPKIILQKFNKVLGFIIGKYIYIYNLTNINNMMNKRKPQNLIVQKKRSQADLTMCPSKKILTEANPSQTILNQINLNQMTKNENRNNTQRFVKKQPIEQRSNKSITDRKDKENQKRNTAAFTSKQHSSKGSKGHKSYVQIQNQKKEFNTIRNVLFAKRQQAKNALSSGKKFIQQDFDSIEIQYNNTQPSEFLADEKKLNYAKQYQTCNEQINKLKNEISDYQKQIDLLNDIIERTKNESIKKQNLYQQTIKNLQVQLETAKKCLESEKQIYIKSKIQMEKIKQGEELSNQESSTEIETIKKNLTVLEKQNQTYRKELGLVRKENGTLRKQLSKLRNSQDLNKQPLNETSTQYPKEQVSKMEKQYKLLINSYQNQIEELKIEIRKSESDKLKEVNTLLEKSHLEICSLKKSKANFDSRIALIQKRHSDQIQLLKIGFQKQLKNWKQKNLRLLKSNMDLKHKIEEYAESDSHSIITDNNNDW